MGLKLPAKAVFAISCAITSTFAHAAWNLDSKQSNVNFISIKKDSIAEVHHFKEVAGTLSQSGEFLLDIDLSSVDTGIEIRDQRMQESLFDIMQFPLAMVKGRLDPGVLDSLKEGQVTAVDVDLSVTMHGATAVVKSQLHATKLSPTSLWVTSAKPMIINTADFELTAGVDKLKALAALPSISYAVPVMVNLRLDYTETTPPPETP